MYTQYMYNHINSIVNCKYVVDPILQRGCTVRREIPPIEFTMLQNIDLCVHTTL